MFTVNARLSELKASVVFAITATAIQKIQYVVIKTSKITLLFNFKLCIVTYKVTNMSFDM